MIGKRQEESRPADFKEGIRKAPKGFRHKLLKPLRNRSTRQTMHDKQCGNMKLHVGVIRHKFISATHGITTKQTITWMSHKNYKSPVLVKMQNIHQQRLWTFAQTLLWEHNIVNYKEGLFTNHGEVVIARSGTTCLPYLTPSNCKPEHVDWLKWPPVTLQWPTYLVLTARAHHTL